MSSIIRATTTSGLQVAPDNSGSLQLQTNGTTTAVTIDTSQNVGIGTTSPVGKLDIGSGNLNFSSTAQRITGDFSNATVANRVIFQSSTTNGNSAITAMPNGTATTSSFQAFNTNDPANTSATQVLALSTESSFRNAINGTGTYLPMTFYTGGSERMRIDSSGYVQGTVNGLSAGRMQAYQYYRLNSTVAGSNATGAQSLFGVGVTLVGSTVYEFEMFVTLSKTAGTTSHTISTLFGGTATLNNILYDVLVLGINTAMPTTITTNNAVVTNTASATVISGTITTDIRTSAFIIKGTVSVNAGGTFIPQYSLSAAPGGAYTTQIGSYIKIAPLGASGANTNIGSWA